MATDVTSLAYYASRAQFGGVAKEKLATGDDYHELLPAKIDVPAAVNLWNMMYGAANTLMPLNDIDLPQADFFDILDQLYSGVPCRRHRTQTGLSSDGCSPARRATTSASC